MIRVTWITAVMLTLNALAVFRLTILITQDTITDPFRRALGRRWQGSLVDFWSCPWCVSMWLGGGAVLLTLYQWWWWQWACLVFAASAVAGFLADRT